MGNDPIVLVQAWLEEARAVAGEPHAMTLATATPDGRPSARVVLLRGLDERGLAFFTNRTSRKGHELGENPRAAIAIHWWELGRQVRAEGAVEEVSAEESSAYWATRPRGSRIAAWASPQSQALGDRDELERRVAEVAERFGDEDVPLPTFWGGYRLVPDAVELWTHRDDRLHDRLRYVREGDGWRVERLAP
ncbi:MAG TPA: pyridoxamine 5'-phosphate oxidase [Gaiellaceae bacterium]|nr:pyridoxamine 5'-phosphate oxidase [Gaiellaceae bacterium]